MPTALLPDALWLWNDSQNSARLLTCVHVTKWNLGNAVLMLIPVFQFPMESFSHEQRCWDKTNHKTQSRSMFWAAVDACWWKWLCTYQWICSLREHKCLFLTNEKRTVVYFWWLDANETCIFIFYSTVRLEIPVNVKYIRENRRFFKKVKSKINLTPVNKNFSP